MASTERKKSANVVSASVESKKILFKIQEKVLSLFAHNKQKWTIATKEKKMYYAVIQKGQSMIHSSSEFEDTTVSSYIYQDP